MSINNFFFFSCSCIGFIFLWRYLKSDLTKEMDVFAKEIWRLRNFQSILIEKHKHSNASLDVQLAYHEIQRHSDYGLVLHGFNKKEKSEEIWIFAKELPWDVDFQILTKLNNHEYSKKPCLIKAGNKVKSIKRLKEDIGEIDSMIDEIEIVSVKSRDIRNDYFSVTFNIEYYGKKEFVFCPFANEHFSFIED